MVGEQERKTVTIPGWIGFSGVVLVVVALFSWAGWRLFVVPSDATRALVCPMHQERAERLRALSEVRPLRDWELTAWHSSEEYVQRWCQ